MIINSQFFITIYTGTQPLSLMTMPSEFDNNLAKKAEYEKFIQSIDTIYGSQSINGNIPKFWTRRTQKTNALGNLQYYYEPHPESTLTQLDSKSCYYFILRDSSMVPVRVPSKGGSVLGFTDVNLLPQVLPLENISLTETHLSSVVANIIDLQPYEEYKYEFKPVSSNWPLSISPISGVLKPSKNSGSIESSIIFCPTTGSCGANTIDYTLDNSCFTYGTTKYTSTMRLSIEPISYVGSEVYSDQFTISCNDCLPKPEIIMVGLSPKNVIETDTSTTTPSYSFYINGSNLNPEETYTFAVEVLSAEWPIVFTAPTGGTLKQSTPRADLKFYFCPTTGLCPPGDPGVPGYSIPTYPKFLTGETPFNVRLRTSITPDSCPGQPVYSSIDVISYTR